MENKMTKEEFIKYSQIVSEVYYMVDLKGYSFDELRAYNLLKYVGEELGVLDKISHFLPTEKDIQCYMEEEMNYYDSFSDYEFDKFIEKSTKENKDMIDCDEIIDDNDDKLTNTELECLDEVRDIFCEFLGRDINKKISNKKKIKTRKESIK